MYMYVLITGTNLIFTYLKITCILILTFVASVKLPPEKFVSSSQSPEDAPTEKKKIILNSSDELYGELRDKNFNAVGSLVSKKAKTITAEFDVRWLYLCQR